MDVELVCSRGILYSCDHHSKEPRSSAVDTGHLTSNISGSIYVCSESLPVFINDTLPTITAPFVLVSGDSDLVIQPASPEYKALIDSPLLRAWYAQNMIEPVQKCIQLPIGLDYHTVWENPTHRWLSPGEGSSPKEQEAVLKSIKTDTTRLCKIYVNFGALDKYGDRRAAMSTIPEELMTLQLNPIPRTLVWKFMAGHAFVLSPFGNGPDCNRTWEALALGAIPIIRGRHFESMFEGLPVLMVDCWSEVTRQLLHATLESFKARSFDLSKLSLAYWMNSIKSHLS
jgi:hypothetical protein